MVWLTGRLNALPDDREDDRAPCQAADMLCRAAREKSCEDTLPNPLIAEYKRRNKRNTITYSLQHVSNANLIWKDLPSIKRHAYCEKLSKLQERIFGVPRVANWRLFHGYGLEDTLREMMKLEYIYEGDGDVFVDYSWERALLINYEIYVKWVLEFDKCTDISKIIRNLSKTGKHGHEERKSTKEAKDANPKPGKGETSLKYSHWPLPTRRTHVDSEENTRGSGICSKLSAKEAQVVTIMDCQAGNPCELRYDPTAHRWHPMIE
ncbi:hypothetical protein Tco_0316734 [Tanacetum coccineum]